MLRGASLAGSLSLAGSCPGNIYLWIITGSSNVPLSSLPATGCTEGALSMSVILGLPLRSSLSFVLSLLPVLPGLGLPGLGSAAARKPGEKGLSAFSAALASSFDGVGSLGKEVKDGSCGSLEGKEGVFATGLRGSGPSAISGCGAIMPAASATILSIIK